VFTRDIWDSILLIMILLVALLLIASLVYWIIGGEFVFAFTNLTLKILSAIFAITIVLMIIVLVLENENPVQTLAWILVLIYIPVVGFIFYLFFGRNWRKVRLFNRKGLEDSINLDELDLPGADCDTEDLSPLALRIKNLLKSNSKAILTCHNQVQIFAETNEAMDSILKDIAEARDHVHLEYFSVANDETGQTLKRALIRKVKEGVKVRFIYDDVACWKLGRKYKKELREAGVEFVPFMPVWIPLLNSRTNYRNHRKIVVVDGHIAYLGGLNIGDKYLSKSKYYGYWRDNVLRVFGEGAISLQALFLVDWYFVSKQNLLTPDKAPKYLRLPPEEVKLLEDIHIQMVASGPDTDHASIMQAYFFAICNAQHSIRITTPYLILDESMRAALKTAALSGVKIDIIVPGKADHHIVWFGSRSYFKELLEVGVNIYDYKGGFLHSKVLIVDDEILSIGTANMDPRSFHHNFEATAMIYHAPTVATAVEAFNEDLSKSEQVTLEQVLNKNIFVRSIESICRLFSPLL